MFIRLSKFKDLQDEKSLSMYYMLSNIIFEILKSLVFKKLIEIKLSS